MYNNLNSICKMGIQLHNALQVFGTVQQQAILSNVITSNALLSTCMNGTQA